jgi:hypothetical protein
MDESERIRELEGENAGLRDQVSELIGALEEIKSITKVFV